MDRYKQNPGQGNEEAIHAPPPPLPGSFAALRPERNERGLRSSGTALQAHLLTSTGTGHAIFQSWVAKHIRVRGPHTFHRPNAAHTAPHKRPSPPQTAPHRPSPPAPHTTPHTSHLVQLGVSQVILEVGSPDLINLHSTVPHLPLTLLPSTLPTLYSAASARSYLRLAARISSNEGKSEESCP